MKTTEFGQKDKTWNRMESLATGPPMFGNNTKQRWYYNAWGEGNLFNKWILEMTIHMENTELDFSLRSTLRRLKK